jgi:hypothetical protein
MKTVEKLKKSRIYKTKQLPTNAFSNMNELSKSVKNDFDLSVEESNEEMLKILDSAGIKSIATDVDVIPPVTAIDAVTPVPDAVPPATDVDVIPPVTAIDAVTPVPDAVPTVIKVLTPDLIFNERIKNAMFTPTADELQLLEESIKSSDGCRDSLIVAINTEGVEDNTLVEGNNRYNICKKHNIAFNVIQKQFAGIEEILDWIDLNQLGRRNLTDDQRKIIIGRRYNREKGKQGGDRGNQYTNLPKGQADTLPNTAEKLAKENHISPATVKRDGVVAKEFEKLETENPDLAKDVKTGKKTLKQIKAEKELKALEKERIQKERENSDGIVPFTEVPVKLPVKLPVELLQPKIITLEELANIVRGFKAEMAVINANEDSHKHIKKSAISYDAQRTKLLCRMAKTLFVENEF